MQQPLATAIIFGLVAALPLVLLFLPAMIVAITATDDDQPIDDLQHAPTV